MEEAVFKEKICALRDKIRKQNISISMGILWKERCEDLDGLLKEADRRMYEEKSLHNREQSAKKTEPK